MLARHIGHGYTVALVGLVLLGAGRLEKRHERILSWMAVLVLSALQSPFAPSYVIVGCCGRRSCCRPRYGGFGGGPLVLLWLGLTVIPPIGATAKIAYSLLTSALVLSVSAWLVVRPRSTPGSSASSGSVGSAS